MKQVSIGSDPQKTRNLGIAALTYNSNTWEGKAGGSGVILGCISQPGLDRTLSQKTKQTRTHIHFWINGLFHNSNIFMGGKREDCIFSAPPPTSRGQSMTFKDALLKGRWVSDKQVVTCSHLFCSLSLVAGVSPSTSVGRQCALPIVCLVFSEGRGTQAQFCPSLPFRMGSGSPLPTWFQHDLGALPFQCTPLPQEMFSGPPHYRTQNWQSQHTSGRKPFLQLLPRPAFPSPHFLLQGWHLS